MTMHTPNSEADQAIERGLPLKDLAPLFPTRADSYQYYGARMASQFSSASRYCAHCGQLADGSLYTFTWQANVHTAKTVVISFILTALAILGGGIASRYLQIRFQTRHRLCDDCRRRHRLIRFVAGGLHHVLFALMMLLLFLTTPAVLFLFVVIFYAPEGIVKVSGATIAGIALLTLVAMGFEMLRRWPIPREVRQIGRFPFVLKCISEDA